MSNINKKYKLYPNKTENIFNIDFKATPICEGCARTIFLQQAQWYAQQDYREINIENTEVISDFCKVITKQKDCPPEFKEIVDKEFWDLI